MARPSRTRRRAFVAAAVFVIACGSAPRPVAAPSPSPSRAADAAQDAAPVDTRRSFDELADASSAAGMRERVRLDALPDGGLVIDAPVDVCVRVAFAARMPARAALVDARDGAERGPPTLGVAGDVPERGAACASSRAPSTAARPSAATTSA
jgi:hypothetical protein